MTTQEALAALRAHDYTLPDRAAAAPPTLPDDVARSLPVLDEEAKLLAVAVLEKQNAPTAGAALLRFSNEETQIAAAASKALLSLKTLPRAADILSNIVPGQDPVVHANLYLAAGKTGEAHQLDKLRALALVEKDPEARDAAQVAAIKIAGPAAKPERTAFFKRVQIAGPDQAVPVMDQLLYLDDPSLAKALLPWLGKNDPVLRLGSDRANQVDRMARMKDLAVWIAHLLGIKFPGTPNHLDVYDPGIVQNCAQALAALPD